MADKEEFVNRKNTHEYPVSGTTTTFDLERTANRKQFESKHFRLAENVCCISTIMTLLLLSSIYIYFQYKEADM